ncbi:MAG: hypothetical protein ACK501_17020 [Planctomycetota bacterium]
MNRLAGLVGSAALAGAFCLYFCVTIVPDSEWKRVPICLGLLLTWAGALLVEMVEYPECLRRIGCAAMFVSLPTTIAVLALVASVR